MRNVKKFYTKGNSLLYWTKVKNPLRVLFNFITIYTARYLPSIRMKNLLYRLVGIKMGENSAVGLGAIFDIFFPELISIGENSIIGYNTTILSHEFLINELRIGKVKIGDHVMIGANCTILPGIEIGDHAIISAHSLVNRNVRNHEFVGGVPIHKIKIKR